MGVTPSHRALGGGDPLQIPPGHNHVPRSLHTLLGPLGMWFPGFVTSLHREASFREIPAQCGTLERRRQWEPSPVLREIRSPHDYALEEEEEGFLQSPWGISERAGA